MSNETPTEPTHEARGSFEDGVREIVRSDARYAAEAYMLVMEALAYTCQRLERQGHVSGRELLEGFRKYVLKQFGPMALVTLAEWGIERGQDVGNIVFNLVDHGMLRKTDEDSIEDFAGAYDFHEAFEAPFVP